MGFINVPKKTGRQFFSCSISLRAGTFFVRSWYIEKPVIRRVVLYTVLSLY